MDSSPVLINVCDPLYLWRDIKIGKIIPCIEVTYVLLGLFLLLVGTNIDKGIYFILGDIIIIQYLIKNIFPKPK